MTSHPDIGERDVRECEARSAYRSGKWEATLKASISISEYQWECISGAEYQKTYVNLIHCSPIFSN
jgi:hypothetical protein